MVNNVYKIRSSTSPVPVHRFNYIFGKLTILVHIIIYHRYICLPFCGRLFEDFEEGGPGLGYVQGCVPPCEAKEIAATSAAAQVENV